MTGELKQAALDYAARGWPVLPLHNPTPDGGCSCAAVECSSVGKHPRTAHGLNDATTDQAKIKEWWTRSPDANVGIRTGAESGFFVLDVDSAEALELLTSFGRKIPLDALCQRTGKGWQFLFKYPDFKVGNSTAKIALDVDVRGDGGYIVAPPSMHYTGRRYEWKAQGQPGPAPEWLLDDLRPTVRPTKPATAPTMRHAAPDAYLEAALQSEAGKVQAAPAGTRNDTLNRAAFSLGQLEAAGLSHADAERVLVDAAVAAGLEEDEARKTFASGWGNGRQDPRAIPERPLSTRQIALTGSSCRAEAEEMGQTAPGTSAAGETQAFVGGPFIDWSRFWDRDHDQAEWVFEDVLARGRGHALYATHKEGKSLFMLYIVAKMATGNAPIVVIYLDYEMGQDDVYDRLESMGYGHDSDLSRLQYALLPSLPPLDTVAGATELTEIVDRVHDEWPDHHTVVVIDTISRAVSGEENSSDTFRDFYACTGIELKRRGITWARLDHGGKDPTKGQRGASGKGDDVDLVWKLARTENGVCLHRELSRMHWVPEKVTFGLTEEPLKYRRLTDDWPAGTDDTANLLDRFELPLDASVRGAQAVLKAAGEGRRQMVIRAALRWRRERPGGAS